MPELPEVETVRRGLAPVLEGRRIAGFLARRGDLRRPIPADLGHRLPGRTVTALERRAKYLLARLDDGSGLLIHLGMSGRVAIHESVPPPPGPHDHWDLETERGAVVRFNDPRRFGVLDAIAAGAWEGHPMLRNLGPEPLDSGFDGPALAERLTGRRGPLKTALLDQGVVAGLGNIYVCEILFRAGLSPRRRAGTVTGTRAARLAGAIRAVLADAIAAGGSTLRDFRAADGELGYFQHRFAVYGREGEPCPGCDCDKGIGRLIQGGRSTFYCSRRQR